jgi:spermidine synthase
MKRYGLLCAALLALFSASAHAEPKTIHSERSLYRNILVTEDDGLRCLTFRRYVGAHRQSCTNLSRPDELVFPYTKMMLGALTLAPSPKRVLIIGLGGGTLPSTLHAILPDAAIDVDELDPAVLKVARDYFSFKPDDRLKAYTDDGRVFVKKQLKQNVKYDLVMLDAFEDDYIPEHMLTREFLEEVKGLLNAGGVLAANTFSSSGLYPYESATYSAVFGTFYNLKLANRVIWAQNGPLADRDTLKRNAVLLKAAFEKRGLDPDWLLGLPSTTPDWPENTRVLTDQFSPSNLLNAR